MSSTLSKFLEQRVADVNAEFDAIVAERSALRSGIYETGTVTVDEARTKGPEHQQKVKELTARADQLKADLKTLRERQAEVAEEEARDARAASVAPRAGGIGGTGGSEQRMNAGGLPVPLAYVTRSEPVYRKDDALAGRSSFFRDVVNSRRGDWQAMQRLSENNAAMGVNERALSTTAGAGGQFAPPLWLVEDWVKYARPARVTADLLHRDVLPEGVSSINLPAVSGGTTVATQTTQNTAVSQTDMTTTSVNSGITTIAGKQIVSLQLLQQSGIPFDRVILGDLAADYAKQLNSQVILGDGTSGALKGLAAAGTSVTWTQATPVVASATVATSFQAQITKVAASLANTRYAPATHLIMSPERWGWITEAVDSQGRPLVPPAAAGSTINGFGTANEPTAQGAAGTFAGLPVYVDPALTVASGNEKVIVMRADDVWLWESELFAQSFDATYADQMSVLFRVHAYSALIARYATAVQVISGTGLAKVTLG